MLFFLCISQMAMPMANTVNIPLVQGGEWVPLGEGYEYVVNIYDAQAIEVNFALEYVDFLHDVLDALDLQEGQVRLTYPRQTGRNTTFPVTIDGPEAFENFRIFVQHSSARSHISIFVQQI
ncbi:hypothetical protein HanHA300_Chr01g0030191 [Helianthus annuus]|nr:hypothetical protein HanHA300_Chr01g0030191 [Helianthus annuus]KAJ0784345.1 hypothetical protein HanLR1_Chr01g0031061 [Helianthus annuus]